MKAFIKEYCDSLGAQLLALDAKHIELLTNHIMHCIKTKSRVFICGNGGSAGNANHIANDFIYGVDPSGKHAVDIESLNANVSVMTCLANDIGYENVYAYQLKAKASAKDLLIVLSGSGNSGNIIAALDAAKALGMTTFAILGYDGGKAKKLADYAIHSNINDMQISEDLQLVVGHIVMRAINEKLR